MDPSQLVSLPDSRPPSGEQVEIIEASDGRALRAASWVPPDARGTVLLLHGYTEFIEKYYEVVERLLARGLAVVTYDHRGQGLSERLLPGSRRGYQTDFGDLVSDALRVHDALAGGRPGPHVLLAHSMGGNVALRVLQTDPGRFDLAALSAPMAGFDRMPLWLMRAIASLHVGLGLGSRYSWGAGDENLDEPMNRVTSDAARFQRAMSFWRHEPSLVVAGPTWRWVREATRSIALVADPAQMARIQTPTLLASAGRDQVVSSRSHEELARHSAKIERVLLPDAMHEILQESDAVQKRFWQHFDDFLGR